MFRERESRVLRKKMKKLGSTRPSKPVTVDVGFTTDGGGGHEPSVVSSSPEFFLFLLFFFVRAFTDHVLATRCPCKF